ncbi:MAG TPA: TauD/TfdA family dioxygenase [Pirellulales bacterium]|nr:TauD/TfdA family dioxygenase [Pirellulales bacterium]
MDNHAETSDHGRSTSTDGLQIEPVVLAGHQTFSGRPFPRVLGCRFPATLDAVAAWVRELRPWLEGQLALDGAILFRGLPLATAEDFDHFVTAFGWENFPYDESLSNAVRLNRTPRVFTANEAPPTVTIFLHHEMAQTPIYPSKLFFFCEHPADEGGATPLCRSDILWQRLVERCPEFARNCLEKGLCYTNVMPSQNDPTSGMGRSWQSTLRAATRDQAENRLQRLGYRWQWLDDGCLRATTPVLPATHELADGRRSFFNQLIAAYRGWKDARNDPSKSITCGDGTPLDAAGARTAAELADELTFDLQWERGDVALVDNHLVMHGRRTFSGTRKVLASLVAATRHQILKPLSR